MEIEYYIVGGGKPLEVKELNDIIYNNNLHKTVRYVGQVYGEKLKWFFLNCNIGISYIPMIEDYDCQPATKTIEYLMAGMPVIATETFENKKIISDYNGILIRDDPQSFAEGLSKIISMKEDFSYEEITNSVKEYSFEHIIDSKLKPILFS
jgi:glycosyltransferase involved in cell wall biosynthesis